MTSLVAGSMSGSSSTSTSAACLVVATMLFSLFSYDLNASNWETSVVRFLPACSAAMMSSNWSGLAVA